MVGAAECNFLCILWCGLRSFAGYLGLALVFGRGGVDFCFGGIFAGAGGGFLLAGGLGAGLLFYGVSYFPDIS